MPARSSITIAFGDEVRMMIEGAPDEATLANLMGTLTASGSLAIMAFPSGARVWLATGHTDTRKGFGSFPGAQGDPIKLIWHDGDGAFLFVKRL